MDHIIEEELRIINAKDLESSPPKLTVIKDNGKTTSRTDREKRFTQMVMFFKVDL